MTLRIVWICLLCIVIQACQYQRSDRSQGPVDIVASAPLLLTLKTPVGKLVYVTPVEGASGLRGLVERSVEGRGYAIATQPSMADYVIYIHLMYAGAADVASARQAVSAGYAQRADITGQGAAVLLADVIVAARAVPQGNNRHGRVVATTSSRHIVAEQEARLAALMPHTPFDKGREALESTLAEAVAEALPIK